MREPFALYCPGLERYGDTGGVGREAKALLGARPMEVAGTMPHRWVCMHRVSDDNANDNSSRSKISPTYYYQMGICNF